MAKGGHDNNDNDGCNVIIGAICLVAAGIVGGTWYGIANAPDLTGMVWGGIFALPCAIGLGICGVMGAMINRNPYLAGLGMTLSALMAISVAIATLVLGLKNPNNAPFGISQIINGTEFLAAHTDFASFIASITYGVGAAFGTSLALIPVLNGIEFLWRCSTKNSGSDTKINDSGASLLRSESQQELDTKNDHGHGTRIAPEPKEMEQGKSNGKIAASTGSINATLAAKSDEGMPLLATRSHASNASLPSVSRIEVVVSMPVATQPSAPPLSAQPLPATPTERLEINSASPFRVIDNSGEGMPLVRLPVQRRSHYGSLSLIRAPAESHSVGTHYDSGAALVSNASRALEDGQAASQQRAAI